VGIQAAVAGAGVTRALSYMVAAEVHAGRLRVVLEDYEPEPIPIHVVYRAGGPARVRAFVELAVARLRAEQSVRLERFSDRGSERLKKRQQRGAVRRR
jgi:DNA-binding transcriptional LysR family regulator